MTTSTKQRPKALPKWFNIKVLKNAQQRHIDFIDIANTDTLEGLGMCESLCSAAEACTGEDFTISGSENVLRQAFQQLLGETFRLTPYKAACDCGCVALSKVGSPMTPAGQRNRAEKYEQLIQALRSKKKENKQ